MHELYLKKEDLIIGKAYKVKGRNFSVAIWTGKDFAGLRHKFSNKFIDHELHWDDDDHYGTVKPIALLKGQD